MTGALGSVGVEGVSVWSLLPVLSFEGVSAFLQDAAKTNAAIINISPDLRIMLLVY
jgi:hypothetical protein